MVDMGALTEREIFDQLTTQLRTAVDCCVALSTSRRKGPLYDQLRKSLSLAEGCCRQASAWREDTRWLIHGQHIARCWKMAGDWLRGYKVNGERIMLAPSEIHKMFLMLADKLCDLHNAAIDIRDKRTHRLGMILPKPVPGPHRATRPTAVLLPPGMRQTDSGLIIPHGTVH
jgi:hypothetical protein